MRREQSEPPYTGVHHPDDEHRYSQRQYRAYTIDPRRSERYRDGERRYHLWEAHGRDDDDGRYAAPQGYERFRDIGDDPGYGYRFYGARAEPLPTPGRDRRGPKGYTRSDERIREDICEQLYRRIDLEVADVSVQVSGGVAVLEGSVPQRYMKYAIEDVCEHTLGVSDINNRLRVEREARSAYPAAQPADPAQSQPPGTDPAEREWSEAVEPRVDRDALRPRRHN